MRPTTGNIWVDRFPELTDSQIRTRIAQHGPVLTDLGQLQPSEGAIKLRYGLESVFVATSSIVSILTDMLDMCRAHSASMYATPKQYLERAYAKTLPIMPYRARCLTGPAGVGKSSLLEAFIRLVPPPSTICVDENHEGIQMRSYLLLSVQSRVGRKNLLAGLIESITSNPAPCTDMNRMAEALCRQIYLTGIPILMADEFQFASGSTRANTLVTQLLHQLAELGAPFVYGANYSLVHRLMSRPQEDRQRLLSNPIILLPDTAQSIDWVNTVAGYLAVAPEVFDLDANRHAVALHRYSGGVKRLLVRLLYLAYAQAPGGRMRKVRLEDVEKAYKSTAYAADRVDLEIVMRQAIERKQLRSDLWCPFELPPEKNVATAQPAIDSHRDRIAEQMIRGALTPSAWQNMGSPPDKRAAASSKKTSTVVPIKQTRASASTLLQGSALVRAAIMNPDKKP